MSAHPFVQARPAPVALPQTHVAHVTEVLSASDCQLRLGDQTLTAALACHVGAVLPGQQVLVVSAEGIAPLVIAAYRSAATPAQSPATAATPPMQFDDASGTLVIQANLLSLRGVAQVELRCGEAVLRLTAQGEILSQAQAITQAAIGPHRIEGASIDLN